ncbi:MAG: TonB-dependent receptor plug domain-containing protein [Acidobacteriota bacterium]
MIKKSLFFISALTIAFLLALPGQDTGRESDEKKEESPGIHYEIVVTATRLETPRRDIASSISVITGEELERSQTFFLLDMLPEVFSLNSYQSGPRGGAASVSLRGANSEHTLVMIDGLEINDPLSPARSFDFAHLTTENIERVEVLRGPQSPLYGSDALGGVINIITKKGADDRELSFSVSGGSWETLFSKAALSGSSEFVSYSLGVTAFQNTGPSAASSIYPGNTEKDGYRNLSLSGRLDFHLAENHELNLILRAVDSVADIDNFGGAFGDDPNNIQKSRNVVLKGEWRSRWLNNWEQVISMGIVAHDRRNTNPPDEFHPFDSEEGWYKSSFYKLDWQNNFFLSESHTLTVGLDCKMEKGESEYSSISLGGVYESNFPQQTAAIAGIYIQDYILVGRSINASLGFRWDYHNRFGNSFTFRLAPALILPLTETKARFVLGSGFKSPSLYQLYAPETAWGAVGNIQLRPEKSLSWEAGLEQPFYKERIILGITYFNQEYKDLIQFDFLSGYLNIGQAHSKGWEVFFQAAPFSALKLQAAYTWMDARDASSGELLLRRPQNQLTAKFQFELNKYFALNLSLNHIGSRGDLNFEFWPAKRVTMEPFTLINLSTISQILPGLEFFIRLENLFDEKYELIKGYGTYGFSAFAGFTIRL